MAWHGGGGTRRDIAERNGSLGHLSLSDYHNPPRSHAVCVAKLTVELALGGVEDHAPAGLTEFARNSRAFHSLFWCQRADNDVAGLPLVRRHAQLAGDIERS